MLRWGRPYLMLMPALVVIVALFGGGLVYGLVLSLGWQPVIGNTTASLSAYVEVLTGAALAQEFWTGLAFSLWISAAGTAGSAVLAVAAALLLRRAFPGRKAGLFFFQASLPVPHLVAAVGMLFLLSQSGLLSRIGAHLGLIKAPSAFPVLVRDRVGLGIILTYLWKEVPFMGLIFLSVLQSVGQDHEEAARTLGASRWQRFRYITVPLIRRSVMSSSLIVFAFVFGAYEIPGMLGVRYPRALPVLAYDLFISPDLKDRPKGMALGIVVSLVVLAVAAGYLALNSRDAASAPTREGDT